MDYTILHRAALPYDGNTYDFQCIRYPDTHVSWIWVDMPPGGTIGLPKHPSEEIFIIQEDPATFTVGSATPQARARQIIIIPAGVSHKFMNLSDNPLQQIDIHVNP